MDFEYPYILLLLLLLPLLYVLFAIAQRRNNTMREAFGDWDVLKELLSDYNPKRGFIKFWLIFAAFTLLIIALANPRIGSLTRKVKRQGVDVYLALDISRSMWAKDVTPRGLDRLEKARIFSLKLVEELKGNRIGLIFFAGEAFLQMPVTLDYSAAKLFLNEGLGDFEITQGTAIDEVIKLVVKSGKSPDGEERLKQKAIIILSDGEEHNKKAKKAAKNARNNGVSIFCISVGSNEGGTVLKERNVNGNFHNDKNGAVVRSKVDKNWLKDIADAGAGKFFDIDEGNSILRKITSSLNKLEKEEFDVQKFDEYETYYQFFVFLSLILLVAEFVLNYRRSEKRLESKNKEIIS